MKRVLLFGGFVKRCTRCKQELPLDRFYERKRGLKNYIAMCKDCHKVESAERYKRDREKILIRSKKKAAESRLFVRHLKANLSCNRCPEKHPATLQFHHKDPYTKKMAVSFAVKSGFSKKTILKEIEKCEVLCANCHAKEHWTED